MGMGRRLQKFRPAVILFLAVGLVVVGVIYTSWYAWRSATIATTIYRQNIQMSAMQFSMLPPEGSSAATTTDDVVSACAATAVDWCSAFSAKYQVGLSFPAGWVSSAEAETPQASGLSPLYSLTVGPKGSEDVYAAVHIYAE